MSTNLKQICVIGDAFIDLTVPTVGLVSGGAAEGDIHLTYGGTANVAYWATKNGAACKFFGKVGGDPLGESFKRNLEKEGIEDLVLVDKTSETGICLCLVSGSGERSMITRRGANSTLSLAEAQGSLDRILDGTSALFFTGYSFVSRANVAAILFLMEQAMRNKREIWFNPGAWNIISGGYIDLPTMEKYAAVLILNLDEAKALVRQMIGEAEEMAQTLGKHFKTVIMTMGKDGCFLVEDGKKLSFFPAEKVERVADTTGAGDAFAGACLAGRLRGYTYSDCCKLGHTVAAKVIQRYGAR